jgi:predicted  nucleic acid-binding Zn-ribbon protein
MDGKVLMEADCLPKMLEIALEKIHDLECVISWKDKQIATKDEEIKALQEKVASMQETIDAYEEAFGSIEGGTDD